MAVNDGLSTFVLSWLPSKIDWNNVTIFSSMVENLSIKGLLNYRFHNCKQYMNDSSISMFFNNKFKSDILSLTQSLLSVYVMSVTPDSHLFGFIFSENQMTNICFVVFVLVLQIYIGFVSDGEMVNHRIHVLFVIINVLS